TTATAAAPATAIGTIERPALSAAASGSAMPSGAPEADGSGFWRDAGTEARPGAWVVVGALGGAAAALCGCFGAGVGVDAAIGTCGTGVGRWVGRIVPASGGGG